MSTQRTMVSPLQKFSTQSKRQLVSAECKFAHKGCHEELPSSQIMDHEKQCGFRGIKCLEVDCDWKGLIHSYDLLKAHFFESHPEDKKVHSFYLTKTKSEPKVTKNKLPCKYASLGCRAKVDEEQLKYHESKCFVMKCPTKESSGCLWEWATWKSPINAEISVNGGTLSVIEVLQLHCNEIDDQHHKAFASRLTKTKFQRCKFTQNGCQFYKYCNNQEAKDELEAHEINCENASQLE